MTLLLHEMRKNRLSLIIWTAAISFMLGVCVLIYPEMSVQMSDVSEMFADMGSFTEAFGMDKVNFGEFMGYFAVECGNVLGLGGALFAALTGVLSISSELRDGTAELLHSHPVSRKEVLTSKLFAVVAQVLVLNLVTVAVVLACCVLVGVDYEIGNMLLVFVAFLLMQLEIAAVTFGISAFVKNGAAGIGIGVGFGFYFMNILANLDDRLDFIRYLTPFSYADGAAVVSSGTIELKYLAAGVVFAVAGMISANVKYAKKDLI